MPSNYETFFDHQRFALVGRSAAKPFPLLSYRGLKRLGKTVYAIDPSAQEIDGDRAYPSLADLPEAVEALIIEVPKGETRDWVAAAAQAGLRDVWIYVAHDTPEAVTLAKESGINLRTGTCVPSCMSPLD